MPHFATARSALVLLVVVSCAMSIASFGLVTISGSAPGSFQCTEGSAPSGTSGSDLRALLPWIATTGHATILELYAQDALLAFDPNFCTLPTSGSLCQSGSSNVTFSGLTSGTQFVFSQYVGIGNGLSLTGTCYTTYGYNSTQIQASASGDCSYAAAITATHGYH